MVIKYFLAGLLMLSGLPVGAQNILPTGKNCGLTLAGKITNQYRNEPLPAATIVLEELNQALQTDLAGNYHFHG